MMLLRDLRFAVRLLARNPAFATAALAVLAVGIGASTAVFSVIRGVMLTPLPYRDASRLMLFRADLPGYSHEPALTAQEYLALRDRSDLFESVAVLNPSPANLTDADVMAAVTGASVSEDFFTTLGVQPLLGRTVNRSDFGSGWVSAVVISYDAWQRHFHGDAHIIGRTIDVNNRPMTVAGVMPPGFRLYLGPGVAVASNVDVWFPRGRGYDDDPFRGQIVIAKLRDHVAIDAAQAAVSSLGGRLSAEQPASYRTGPVRLSLAPIAQDLVSAVKPALLTIAGAVGFVLLVACANLANLLLARASARTREIAVRIAIGASQGHIVRQLATEGLVLGAIGAGAGLLLAQWAIDLLLRLAPAALPRREAIHIDGAVAGFAVAVSLLCALAVSLVPAWPLGASGTSASLKAAGSRRAARTRGALVAAQLALSLMLLVGAGLMARAFASLRAVPLGFDPHRVLSLGVALDGRRFNPGTLEDARRVRLAFYQQLSAAVSRLPGVETAGVGWPSPLSGKGTMPQRFALGPDAPQHQAEGVIACAGYLEALRVPLVAGRYFTRDDDSRPEVILDQRLAGEIWPGQAAIGRRLLMIYTVGEPRWVEVVGVASHVQNQELRGSGLPQIWVSYGVRSYSELDLVVRAADPGSLLPAIRETIQQLGAGRPVHDVRLLDEYVADASADTRFALFVLGGFACIAVALAAIGVYGVVAYATARRSREIALRIALGSSARGIVTLILRDGAGWTALGLAVGVAGAFALSRYLESLLFKVGARDPATFAGVAVLLALVAIVATALPALRAARVDPMLALKAD